MKYKIAVFDMDGTILNTLEDLKDSLNYALKECGFKMRSLDEVRNFVGNGIPKLIERALPSDVGEEDKVTVYNVFTERYKVHCKDKTCVYEGINEALDSLKANGMKVCVVSNKDDYAVKELSNLYFGNRFDLSLGRLDGVPKKPAPDMVFAVLKRFGLQNSEAVYIGDSDVDKMTAENSELDFIGVSWGFKGYDFLKKIGTKVIVNTAEDMLKEILKI